MTEQQQILFFLVVMVLQWVVLLHISHLSSPSLCGSNEVQSMKPTWCKKVFLMKKASLFVAGFAYSGFIATMFESSFALAVTIGIVGGLYNFSSNRVVEMYARLGY